MTTLVSVLSAASSRFEFAAPVLRHLANWRARRKLSRIGALDDHLLHDIGLTREDLALTLSAPLDVDPVGEIYRLRRPAPVRGERHR